MTNSTLLSQTSARRMQGCIGEYERIRRRESTAFKIVRDFCICHRFSRRNFMKIYRRYRQDPPPDSPVPQRRGPKYCTRRTDLQTEERIINLRRQGNSRCEIRDILRENAASVPVQPPSATSAGGMDRTDYTGFKNRNGGKLS